jgi:hypothetical protein
MANQIIRDELARLVEAHAVLSSGGGGSLEGNFNGRHLASGMAAGRISGSLRSRRRRRAPGMRRSRPSRRQQDAARSREIKVRPDKPGGPPFRGPSRLYLGAR